MVKTKIAKLTNILRNYVSVVVAYSGGVDSTFLLKIAHDTLKDKVLAVIAKSETYTEEEANFAGKFCLDNLIKYEVIHTSEFQDKNFISNPPERCYYCKKELFSKLRKMAVEKGYAVVIEGSTITDKSDYRPGSKAKEELGVKSPMNEAGISKDELRKYSREMKLPTWNMPSMACLASRIPYGTKITTDILRKVGEGEKFLRTLGLKQVRVRHHGDLARVEVEKERVVDLLEDGIADKIDKKFKDLGYAYVTIDLKGYRTGSMNEVLSLEEKVN